MKSPRRTFEKKEERRGLSSGTAGAGDSSFTQRIIILKQGRARTRDSRSNVGCPASEENVQRERGEVSREA
jgi:hypothetical protein